MRKRAIALRAAAARAKALVQPLGTHMDLPVTAATGKDVWNGPYATDSTQQLVADQKSVRGLAGDLQASAEAWLREADRLDTAAAAAPK